jgi:tyrosine-protein phosphatase YwqE
MSLFNLFGKQKQQELPISTDIHCHLVPGVDDGSQSVELSVEILERMHAMGFKRFMLSPHSTQDTFENTPETIAAPFASLQKAVAERGLPIELSHHFEYRLDEYFLQQLAAGNIKPLPRNFLLIENSFAMEPWNLESMVFDLRVKGYVPILAHPERYLYYSRNHRERYAQLHDKGLLFQINLLSLAGHYGKQDKQTAEWLLEKGMVDFLGSDVHRMSHIESIEAYLASRDFAKHCRYFTDLRNDEL